MMMRLKPRCITLSEWEHKTIPYREPDDSDPLTPDKAIALSRSSLDGKVQFRATADGLEIDTFSFVGLLQVGPIRLIITPKINELRLAPLLRYAYGLRHLARFGEVSMPTTAFGFHDLLVSLLLSEAEELVYRGLSRSYIEISGPLESPRGRLDTMAIVRRGGLRDSTLPCFYFERSSDNLLNQVLRAGLTLAASVTTDPDLRRATLRLADRLEDVRELDSSRPGHRCQSRAINHPAYGTLPTSADIDPSAARLARNRHCRRRWHKRARVSV